MTTSTTTTTTPPSGQTLIDDTKKQYDEMTRTGAALGMLAQQFSLTRRGQDEATDATKKVTQGSGVR